MCADMINTAVFTYRHKELPARGGAMFDWMLAVRTEEELVLKIELLGRRFITSAFFTPTSTVRLYPRYSNVSLGKYYDNFSTLSFPQWG